MIKEVGIVTRDINMMTHVGNDLYRINTATKKIISSSEKLIQGKNMVAFPNNIVVVLAKSN